MASNTPEKAPPLLEYCDQGKLESALESPFISFGDIEKYPDLLTKAAVLAIRVSKAHACADGNKRVSLILLGYFLLLNGVRLTDTGENLEDQILRVTETPSQDEEAAIAGFAAWLEGSTVPL